MSSLSVPLPEPLGEPEHADLWQCAVCTLLGFDRPAAATTLIAGTLTCQQHTAAVAIRYPALAGAVEALGGQLKRRRR